jgi:mono/diheme cytochrome c family protein
MYHRVVKQCGLSAIAVVVLVCTGCGKSDPPVFRLDMTNVVAKQIAPEQRQTVADVLEAIFGTPDEPHATAEMGLDIRKLRMAAGPVWGDEQGGKHGLYRRHCAHCHGISGDGRGPTAMILNPYPRDYRPGIFKFKSTTRNDRPTDDDLTRVVKNGIPGTAMPSFALLPPDEVAALVEYVKYLSMRGQMELALEEFAFNEELPNPADNAEVRTAIGEMLTSITDGWKEASEKVVRPEDATMPPAERTKEQIAESITKGRALFYGTKANCFTCHGPTGLGDGQQADFDDWTKAHNKFREELAALPSTIEATEKDLRELKGEDRDRAKQRLDEQVRELTEREMVAENLLPARNAIPRNLREGIYRGGGRPIDIFWRVTSGIPGTPMPAAPATLTQEEIWQLVDYVHSLPFEPASRPPHRAAVNVGSVSP